MVDTPRSSSVKDRARADLRQHLCAQRKSLSPTALAEAANALKKNCTPLLQSAATIAGYFAVNGEIPIEQLLSECRVRGATTLAPIMQGDRLAFSPFDEITRMQRHRLGIIEPDTPENGWLDTDAIDIVLVPLVAFDQSCNRLGMGGGFYDRSFAQRKAQSAPPLLVGVAHAFQQVDSVASHWWDVPLDWVVTDAGVFQRRNKS